MGLICGFTRKNRTVTYIVWWARLSTVLFSDVGGSCVGVSSPTIPLPASAFQEVTCGGRPFAPLVTCREREAGPGPTWSTGREAEPGVLRLAQEPGRPARCVISTSQSRSMFRDPDRILAP